MSGSPERRVVQEACQGSREAFAELTRRHEQRMRILAARLVGCPDDAEDVVQEALAKALANLSQLREPDKFGAWLNCIVVNECRRLRRPASPLALLLPDQLEAPEARPLSGRDLGAVLAEIASRILKMSPRESVAAAWFYFHGASYAEIAKGLETTVEAVQSALQRARTKLREEEMDIRKKGDVIMENSESDLRDVVRTGDLVVEDLTLGEHRWGENQFSCRVKNISGGKVFLALDIRSCVAKAGNWQTQWFYELEPGEERLLSESYNVLRLLCPWYAVFRGPGTARIRVTLARLNENEHRQRWSQFIRQAAEDLLFQRWFEVIVPADSQAEGVPVAPVLPKGTEISVDKVDIGSASPGKHRLGVACGNNTDEARQVHVQVETPAFGWAERFSLKPNGKTVARLDYYVHPDDVRDQKGERRLLLQVIQLPLNVDELDLEDAGTAFVPQYLEEVPQASVAKASFALT